MALENRGCFTIAATKEERVARKAQLQRKYLEKKTIEDVIKDAREAREKERTIEDMIRGAFCHLKYVPRVLGPRFKHPANT